MGQAVDANLAALGGDGLGIAAIDADKILPVRLGRRQPLRELDAHARLGGIDIGFVVENTEPVLGDQRVVGIARARIVDERQTCFQRLNRRTPLLATLEGFVQRHQCCSLLRVRRGSVVGDPGARAGIDRTIIALAANVGINWRCEQRISESQPGCCIIRLGHCRLPQQLDLGNRVGGLARPGGRLGNQLAGGFLAGLVDRLECRLIALRIGANVGWRKHRGRTCLGGRRGLLSQGREGGTKRRQSNR